MITFVTPSALLLFIDTVGREEIRTCEAKKRCSLFGGKSFVLSNMFMICHSKLQVKCILLMLVSLPIKGTGNVVKSCLNEAKSISADQCSVFIC